MIGRLKCLFGRHQWTPTGETVTKGDRVAALQGLRSRDRTLQREACLRACGIAPRWVEFDYVKQLKAGRAR